MVEVVKQEKNNNNDANSQIVDFIGKIIEVKNAKEFIVETFNGKKTILVDLTKDITFEEGISHEFELGNIVMFETRDSVILNNNNDPLELKIIKIVANDRDEIINIDKRETISGYLGVFPDVILDCCNRETTVKEGSIVVVTLNKEVECSWEYETDDDNLMLISEGEEDAIPDNLSKHYWGFVAKIKGENELKFVLIDKDNEVIKEIAFIININ